MILLRTLLIFTLLFGFFSPSARAQANDPETFDRPQFLTGLGFDHFSRTISWDEGEGLSSLKALFFTLQEDIKVGRDMRLKLMAGLSLSSFNGLVFRELPISLEYGAGAIEGLVLGAALRSRLFKLGDFEIEAVGRVVSSFGSRKIWPLEGFPVEGEAIGRPSWFEVAAGARVVYLFFGKFYPYIAVSGNWLRGSFQMSQTLEDLSGQENKKVKGKSLFLAAFGGTFDVSPKLTIHGEAGFLPYAGGVDGAVSLGIFYVF